ncbi:MAG: hypothetical protein JWL79_1762 [Frankiales bacterium]|nr:hypothetical protein [Frankiales bacterium]
MSSAAAELLRRSAPTRRTIDVAQAEQQRMERFADSLQVNPDTDAVLLYLTHLAVDKHVTGARLREALRHLDLARALQGEEPFSSHPHVKTFVHGMHQALPLGRSEPRTPIYLEDLHAMLDAVDADQLQQRRDVALLHVANATRLPMTALAALTWNDVRLRGVGLRLTIRRRPSHSGRPFGGEGPIYLETVDWPHTVAAMRALRLAVGPSEDNVFTRGQGPPHHGALEGVVRVCLPVQQGCWHTSDPLPEDVLQSDADSLTLPRPRQLRDKALLMLGFAACLDTHEAVQLRYSDVVAVDRGLVITIRSRRLPVAVPRGGGRHEPVNIWQQWAAHLTRINYPPDAPAFPAIVSTGIRSLRGLQVGHLSEIVQGRATRAGLSGGFSYTSLRIGFIRTAARTAVPDDLIAHQAGMTTLYGVASHRQRELIIRDSVLRRIGL